MFAVCSLLTLQVSSLPQPLLFRFLTGIGLGGATPLFVAVATEYAPKRLRGQAISVVYAAFPLGGVLAGLISSSLVPRFGWQAVFIIGAALPLGIAALTVFALPESIAFLLTKANRQADDRRLLGKMGARGVGPATRIVATETGRGERVGLARLFAEVPPGRTLLLWLMCFGVLMARPGPASHWRLAGLARSWARWASGCF